MTSPAEHPRDPLHGITLENILNQHRRRAEGGGPAFQEAAEVLEGDLESGAVCGGAERILGEKAWSQKSQIAGHPRPAGWPAKHEMNERQNGKKEC